MRAGSNPASVKSCLRGLNVPVDSLPSSSRRNTGRAYAARRTLESARKLFACAGDQTNRFTDLVGLATLTESVGVAPRLAAFHIEPQQRHGQAMREKRRYLADRAWASLAVVERKIAFGGSVIL